MLLTRSPVDIYPAVQRLNKLVGFTFAFPTAIAGKRRPLHLPEVQIMTLVIISTKLLFPFDDIKRYPESAREPATQAIDWQIWAQVQRHFHQRETSSGRIGKGNEILINEKDVFNMTPSQLDEYMDWYENSWLDLSKGVLLLKNIYLIGLTLTFSLSINRGQFTSGSIPTWSNGCGKPACCTANRKGR